MLTFLRKIRKSLIEAGSARKYLLYAIGEILLVAIGILLALGVNNLNENRKILKFEQEILLEVLQDMRNDTSDINNQLKRYYRITRNIDYCLDYASNKAILDQPIGGIFGGIYFNLNSTSFETLQNKGLHSLSNGELRRTISEYYNNSNWLLDMMKMESQHFYSHYQVPFQKKHFRYIFNDNNNRDIYPKDKVNLAKTNDLEIFLGFKKDNLLEEYRFFKFIIEDAEAAMKSIQNYLETTGYENIEHHSSE